jgi:hypothetical protein
MLRTHVTRTRLGLVLAVAAGALLGAVFGQPGNGQAAATAAPKNTALPTISGPAEVGNTLTATRGKWTGSPTSFHFAWSRCDATGAACVAIGGATGKTYTVAIVDVGHTLRVTVTARNSDGAASATSTATAVVPLVGCPGGTGPIPITDVSPPGRLQIVGGSIAPRPTRSTRSIRLRFEVQACGGRAVQGATVFAVPIPYNQFSGAQATTGSDGTVTFTEARRSGFPASRHQRLLAVFVRAWKQGEPLTGGVSSTRVVAFRFAGH